MITEIKSELDNVLGRFSPSLSTICFGTEFKCCRTDTKDELHSVQKTVPKKLLLKKYMKWF